MLLLAIGCLPLIIGAVDSHEMAEETHIISSVLLTLIFLNRDLMAKEGDKASIGHLFGPGWGITWSVLISPTSQALWARAQEASVSLPCFRPINTPLMDFVNASGL